MRSRIADWASSRRGCGCLRHRDPGAGGIAQSVRACRTPSPSAAPAKSPAGQVPGPTRSPRSRSRSSGRRPLTMPTDVRPTRSPRTARPGPLCWPSVVLGRQEPACSVRREVGHRRGHVRRERGGARRRHGRRHRHPRAGQAARAGGRGRTDAPWLERMDGGRQVGPRHGRGTPRAIEKGTPLHRPPRPIGTSLPLLVAITFWSLRSPRAVRTSRLSLHPRLAGARTCTLTQQPPPASRRHRLGEPVSEHPNVALVRRHAGDERDGYVKSSEEMAVVVRSWRTTSSGMRSAALSLVAARTNCGRHDGTPT
jgi:hypothetical protein